MARTTQPSCSIISGTVKVEVIHDLSDCTFQGFEMCVRAVKIWDVHIDGRAGDPPFARGGKAVNVEMVDHFDHFVVVDDNGIPHVIGGKSP